MKMSNKLGASTYHSTINCAEPNPCFSQSASFHIPIMNVGSHGINQDKSNEGFQRPNHLNPQLVIPPHGHTPVTPTRLVSTQAI